jgi:XRE family transcriptional regulator, regulator of sulfur utilization
MKVAERIRLKRVAMGLSQENMADLLNLSTTAYGDIERGKTDLTLSRLVQISEVLNLTPADLLTESTAPPMVNLPAIETFNAQIIPAQPERDRADGQTDLARLLIEKQQAEIEELRREAAHWKARYDERVRHDLTRALGTLLEPQPRERIGF